MAENKRSLRVNTMYGADGRLRTSYFEGDAAKVARRNVKAFNKELSKYEKEFAAYASLDIDSAKINDTNSKYIFGKLGVAEKYIDYIPEGDMADSMGNEFTAIAGNKSGYKIGVGAKIASKFQPFFEKQAAKNPKLQKLSDRVTKAANGGRMPLTADSAAMMRIAFDKKFYNDCRRPGVNIDELRQQHAQSIANLTKMALFDGVERSELSAKFSEKLIGQMQIDETLTDIYSGMADGSIRLADDKPATNANGEVIKVGGKTLYERSKGFVSAEKDAKGRNKLLDSWGFETREPQTIYELLRDYQEKLDRYAASCETEADFKRMLASDSYRNLERNVKTFAEADCPDDAARFKYEFMRKNLESCKNWALEHDHRSPYANLIIPPSWDERTKDNEFVKSYSTDDYYGIDEKAEIHDKATKVVLSKSDNELAQNMADECSEVANELSDTDKFNERLNALEAENKELREKLAQMEQRSVDDVKDDTAVDESEIEESITEVKSDTDNEKSFAASADETKVSPSVSLVEQAGSVINDVKSTLGGKILSAANMLTNAVSSAEALKREIQEQYHSNSETILDVDKRETKTIQSESPLMLEQGTDVEQVVQSEEDSAKYYIAKNAVALSYSFESPIDEDHPELGSEVDHDSMIVPEHSVMKVVDGRVVSLPYAGDDHYYFVHDSVDVTFDKFTTDQFNDICEISKEQFDTLMPLEAQIEEERRIYDDEKVKLEMDLEFAEDYPDRSERSAEEINAALVELKANSIPSYETYMTELNTVLESIGIEPKTAEPNLSGRIDKYDLDIDFAKLDYIEVVMSSDVYAGGIDDNGHECKDNYERETSSVMIYATTDDRPMLVREDDTAICTAYEDVSKALNEISGYLDQSAKDADVNVFIKPKDGEKVCIDPVAILNASLEANEKAARSDRIAKINNSIPTEIPALDKVEKNEVEFE